MVNTFIISIPHSRLRPLAWQGIQAQSAFDQLSHTLNLRLGERQASILAEPISDLNLETIDWYAKAHGTPVKLAELSVLEQNQVRTEFQNFASKVRTLANSLKQSTDSNSFLAGALLELALSYPSDEYLYALKDEQGNLAPLLLGWGFAPSGVTSEPENITALRLIPIAPSSDQINSQESESLPEQEKEQLADASNTFVAAGTAVDTAITNTQPQKEDETTVVRHVFPFPWALFAFLLAIVIMLFLLFWLLPRPGVSENIGFSGCSRETITEVSPKSNFDHAELYRSQGMEEALRAELDRLRREYEMRLWMCDKQTQTEPEPEPIIPPEPEPIIPPEPDVPPVPKLIMPKLPADLPPKPKPVPKPKTQPDTMVIPENPTDLQFLEGCWSAETGLKSSKTGMPISVKYCFDKNGNGNIFLTERDKRGRQAQQCKGGAKASLRGGRLYINDMGAVCSDGSRYEKERVTCRNADQSRALCTGVGNPSGNKNWQDKPFTRTSR